MPKNLEATQKDDREKERERSCASRTTSADPAADTAEPLEKITVGGLAEEIPMVEREQQDAIHLGPGKKFGEGHQEKEGLAEFKQ